MSAATTPQWKWEDWFLVALIKKKSPLYSLQKLFTCQRNHFSLTAKKEGKNTVREKRRNELKRFGIFKNFNECTSSYVLHMIRCICKTSDKTQLLNHFHQDRKIYLAYCAQQERLQRYLASPCWDSFLRYVSHTLNIHAEGSLYATATEWGKGYLLQM